MVQKSGKLTSWGNGSLSTIIYQGFFFRTIQTAVGNGISEPSTVV